MDQDIIERQADWFEWLLAARVAIVLAQAILQWALGWCQPALKNRIAIHAAAQFVHRLIRVPRSFFGQRSPGSIGSRVPASEDMAKSASNDLSDAMVGAVSLAMLAVIMMVYSPLLTLISVAIIAAVTGLNLLLSKHMREGDRRAALERTKLSGRTIQGLAQIGSLKAGGTEDVFF